MKTRRRRLELFHEYLTSLGIAFCIGLAMIPFLRTVPVSLFIVVPGSALLYGTAFFVLGFIRSRIRIGSFTVNIIVQTLLMAATVLGCFIAIVWFFVYVQFHRQGGTEAVWPFVVDFVFLKPLNVVLEFAGLMLAGLINFSFELGKKLGPGVLTNWITGKYYTPREEELVFMFVDMKDSTMLAEKLGAIKFSSLIRDFFQDMTVPLLESRARVSHYIGDEAVIYWKPEDAIKPKGCIEFFKSFEEMIQDRAAYYQASYGLVPEFKAGMHIGPVVATEVGEVKSEIVFHGDVLNTTARIQSMCGELGHKLLASRNLASKLTLPKGAVMSALGPVHLKGKAEEMELVGIEV